MCYTNTNMFVCTCAVEYSFVTTKLTDEHFTQYTVNTYKHPPPCKQQRATPRLTATNQQLKMGIHNNLPETCLDEMIKY